MTLSAEQAKGLAMFLVPSIENEIPLTKKILAAVPQGQLGFKLGDKGRTAQELMWHVVQSDIWFAEGIAAGEFAHSDSKGPAPESVDRIVAEYEKGLPVALGKVKAMTPEQLAKPISFFNIMNFPAVMYLQFLNNHMIHHRGQLSTYLRAMNAHVPGIYGGSADEPFEMPAGASS